MGKPVVTSVELRVPADREQELLDGFSEMIQSPTPVGLVRAELLRSVAGSWRIRDPYAVRYPRGAPPVRRQ
jgi:hypothetical protein